MFLTPFAKGIIKYFDTNLDRYTNLGNPGPTFCFSHDFTLFVIDIRHIMLISLFPTPFYHIHFRGSGGLIGRHIVLISLFSDTILSLSLLWVWRTDLRLRHIS